MKFKSFKNWGNIVHFGESPYTNKVYIQTVGSTKSIQWGVNAPSPGENTLIKSDDEFLFADQWVHLVVTVSEDDMKIYKNGDLVSTSYIFGGPDQYQPKNAMFLQHIAKEPQLCQSLHTPDIFYHILLHV